MASGQGPWWERKLEWFPCGSQSHTKMVYNSSSILGFWIVECEGAYMEQKREGERLLQSICSPLKCWSKMKGKPAVPHLPSTSIIHLVKMVCACVCVFYCCNYDSVVFQLWLYPILPLSIFIRFIIPLAILKWRYFLLLWLALRLKVQCESSKIE